MTKGERKTAIAVALKNKENAEIAYNEAHKALNEAHKLGIGVVTAQMHLEDCHKAMWNARNEYDAITKCKAWRSL